MALRSLLDLELRVPDPDELVSFWVRRGLQLTGDGVLGTPERPSQLRVGEGRYRHVSQLHVACDSPADLSAAAARLDALGIASARTDISLRVADPLGDHEVVLVVTAAPPLAPATPDPTNRPGVSERVDRRSLACTGDLPHAPRRVGHVVFGTPDVAASAGFYEALGFRISDIVGGGLGVFLRCSSDHHNLLLAPAPVPCLNHYALEMDGVDAIGLAAMEVLAERADCSVAGLGRHVVGANLFWYLLDPAGGMFELFADMDQIHDDEQWERLERRDDWDPFTIGAWMPGAPTPDFFLPVDLDDIAAQRELSGRV